MPPSCTIAWSHDQLGQDKHWKWKYLYFLFGTSHLFLSLSLFSLSLCCSNWQLVHSVTCPRVKGQVPSALPCHTLSLRVSVCVLVCAHIFDRVSYYLTHLLDLSCSLTQMHLKEQGRFYSTHSNWLTFLMDYIISLVTLFHLVPLRQMAVFKNKPEHLTFLSSIQPLRHNLIIVHKHSM